MRRASTSTRRSSPSLPPQTSRPEPRDNHLLAALSEPVQRRIFSRLEPVPLELGSLLSEAGRPIRHIYFPTDSVISMQYLLEDGHSAALALVGNEGLLDITLFLGCETARSCAYVQSAGYAFRLPKDEIRAEFDRHEELHGLLLRYTQALISQISQTAVCNRHHSIDQQLCRWLLLSTDRLSHNHLTMTQEFISNMLGVRREGVTEAASRLRSAGVISYKRGHIIVLDRLRLEQAACECYDVVRSETARVLGYLPARQRVSAGHAVPAGQRARGRTESPELAGDRALE